mgnify:CR=1 FL=1
MNTRGQQRSAYALEMVSAVPENKKKDFATFSAGVPAMILQNGLGQTLAFLCSKGTDKHTIMLEIIKNWVARVLRVSNQNDREFIRGISAMEQSQYLEAQQEVLRLLEWVKRYANAGL